MPDAGLRRDFRCGQAVPIRRPWPQLRQAHRRGVGVAGSGCHRAMGGRSRRQGRCRSTTALTARSTTRAGRRREPRRRRRGRYDRPIAVDRLPAGVAARICWGAHARSLPGRAEGGCIFDNRRVVQLVPGPREPATLGVTRAEARLIFLARTFRPRAGLLACNTSVSRDREQSGPKHRPALQVTALVSLTSCASHSIVCRCRKDGFMAPARGERRPARCRRLRQSLT